MPARVFALLDEAPLFVLLAVVWSFVAAGPPFAALKPGWQWPLQGTGQDKPVGSGTAQMSIASLFFPVLARW
jgi:hypothetical protein